MKIVQVDVRTFFPDNPEGRARSDTLERVRELERAGAAVMLMLQAPLGPEYAKELRSALDSLAFTYQYVPWAYGQFRLRGSFAAWPSTERVPGLFTLPESPGIPYVWLGNSQPWTPLMPDLLRYLKGDTQ